MCLQMIDEAQVCATSRIRKVNLSHVFAGQSKVDRWSHLST
jgi:hypothetical protein